VYDNININFEKSSSAKYIHSCEDSVKLVVFLITVKMFNGVSLEIEYMLFVEGRHCTFADHRVGLDTHAMTRRDSCDMANLICIY
jgi:hypothetical protein